ncbi:hypothetical protein LTR17_010714 [Elasticomyces elasticus]|nr:hypothetical protein LTR17_010714 [Elasticomyces elasticus]
MANEARYHYPEDDSGADPAIPQGFKISVFDGQFEVRIDLYRTLTQLREQILDSTIDSNEAKSSIDLSADPADDDQYPRRFSKGDAVRATVTNKQGSLQAGNFVVKAVRFDKQQGIWEYKLRIAGDKFWIRDRNLSRVV